MVSRPQGELGWVTIPLPGVHNVRNTLGAVGVALAACADAGGGARPHRLRRVHRRFEPMGSHRGAAIVDDYAHHPTEAAATLAAARQSLPRHTLHAVFQPHLFFADARPRR
ncbi:MAG: cyanophycin synthetase [Thermoanaerobaculia bacterium]